MGYWGKELEKGQIISGKCHLVTNFNITQKYFNTLHFYNPFYVSTIKMQKLSVSVYQKNGPKMAAFVNWNGCNYKWVVVWVTQVLHVSNVAGNIFNADCKSCKCKFTQNRSRYSKIQTSTWNNTIKTALSFNGKAIKIVRTVTYRMERLPKKKYQVSLQIEASGENLRSKINRKTILDRECHYWLVLRRLQQYNFEWCAFFCLSASISDNLQKKRKSDR